VIIMPDLNFIKVDRSTEGVAKIIFDRPKYNILNIEMIKNLNQVLEELRGDSDLKCIIIAAEGRYWCTGVEVGDHKPEKVDEMIENFNRIFDLIHGFDVPTIAAVHGACLGGGMEVAIACDIIMASEKATFGQPEIKLGFFPPYAAIQLPKLVGMSKAIEICTSGRRYAADEAKSMGFVSHVVHADVLDDKVNEMVGEITYCSSLIIRMNKSVIKKCMGLDYDDASRQAADYFLNTLMKTEDTLEGIRSYEEKEKPIWKNK